MGYEVTISLDEAASERVAAVVEDVSDVRRVSDYINGLIQRDADDAFDLHPAVAAELRIAFAQPESAFREWKPDEFLAEVKRRHACGG